MTASLRALLNTQPDPNWGARIESVLQSRMRETEYGVSFEIGDTQAHISFQDTPIPTKDLAQAIQGISQDVDASWAPFLFGHSHHAYVVVTGENEIECAQIAVNIALELEPAGLLWDNGCLIGQDIVSGIALGDMPDTFALFSIIEWADEFHIGLAALGTFDLLGKLLVMPLEDDDSATAFARLASVAAYLLHADIDDFPTSLPDVVSDGQLGLDIQDTYIVVAPQN